MIKIRKLTLINNISSIDLIQNLPTVLFMSFIGKSSNSFLVQDPSQGSTYILFSCSVFLVFFSPGTIPQLLKNFLFFAFMTLTLSEHRLFILKMAPQFENRFIFNVHFLETQQIYLKEWENSGNIWGITTDTRWEYFELGGSSDNT